MEQANTGTTGKILSISQIPDAVAEAEFLSDLFDGFKKWSAAGNKEYADAYKVLIHNFTNVETTEIPQ